MYLQYIVYILTTLCLPLPPNIKAEIHNNIKIGYNDQELISSNKILLFCTWLGNIQNHECFFPNMPISVHSSLSQSDLFPSLTETRICF